MDTISQPAGLLMFGSGWRYELRATLAYDPVRAGRGARRRTRNIRPGRQRPGTQSERAPAVPAPTAEAAVTADHPGGRAGTGPGGRAGSVPYRFTDKPGECRRPDCEQCPCFSQHVSNVCACCRAGLHDRTCGPPPVRLVKADK